MYRKMFAKTQQYQTFYEIFMAVFCLFQGERQTYIQKDRQKLQTYTVT
jgi:hypothetical protein